LDGPVDALLRVQSNPVLRACARWLTKGGEWWSVGLAALVAALFFFFRNRFKTARAIVAVTLAGLATGLAATLLRSTFGRARPNAAIAQGFYGPWHDAHWIFGQYQFSSFPSGHAATLVGLAAAAWIVNRRAGIWVGLFAALVSWSRIAQSSHHFSDVVAAGILGLWLGGRLEKRLRGALRPGLCAAERAWVSFLRNRRPALNA
jgi:membrane-associated phospholipid phosphatase